MDLNEIYVFTKVVELGSFTKASEYLGIPKSRISRKVSSLERELGIQLLYRTTRQIELTPAGKKYFSKGHHLIQELDSLNSEISSFSDDISGEIRVTAPEDLAIRFFPKIASEFMSLYPKVTLDFYLTGRRVDLIKEPIDLALRVGHLQDSTLKVKRVGEISNILVASPAFLALNKDINELEDLLSVPTIGFGEMGKIKEWHLKSGKKELHLPIRPKLSTNSMDVYMQFALEGKGVALVPSVIAQNKISEGSLIHLFKSFRTTPMPIQFVTAPQKEIPLKVKRFMDFSIEKLASNFN